MLDHAETMGLPSQERDDDNDNDNGEDGEPADDDDEDDEKSDNNSNGIDNADGDEGAPSQENDTEGEPGAPTEAFMPHWGRSTRALHKDAKNPSVSGRCLAGFPDFLYCRSASGLDFGGIGEGKTPWGVPDYVLKTLFTKEVAPNGQIKWNSSGIIHDIIRQVSRIQFRLKIPVVLTNEFIVRFGASLIRSLHNGASSPTEVK